MEGIWVTKIDIRVSYMSYRIVTHIHLTGMIVSRLRNAKSRGTRLGHVWHTRDAAQSPLRF